MNLQKETRIRWPEYRRAAKDQDCTYNSPRCSYINEQSCLRHLNEEWAGKGMRIKADDFASFDACQPCEDYYNDPNIPKAERDWYAFRAMYRTLRNRIDRGILKV